MPETEHQLSDGSARTVSLSLHYFSTWYFDKGVEEAIGWVLRDVVLLAQVMPCRAGVHGSAA